MTSGAMGFQTTVVWNGLKPALQKKATFTSKKLKEVVNVT